MKALKIIFHLVIWIVGVCIIFIASVASVMLVHYTNNRSESFLVNFNNQIIPINFSTQIIINQTNNNDIYYNGVQVYSHLDIAKVRIVIHDKTGVTNVYLGDTAVNNIYTFDFVYLGLITLSILLLVIATVIIIKKNKKKFTPVISTNKTVVTHPEQINTLIQESSQKPLEIKKEEIAMPATPVFTEVLDEQKLQLNEDVKNEPKKSKKDIPIIANLDVKWVLILADNNDAEAQYALATFYAIGYKELEQNDDLAVYWLKKAAKNGYTKAINILNE